MLSGGAFFWVWSARAQAGCWSSRARILTPAAFEALTIRSASSQSNWPFFWGSMKRHWNSVFCQPNPASLSLPRSRSVVFWLPQMKTFMPYSGLLAFWAVLAAGGPLAATVPVPPVLVPVLGVGLAPLLLLPDPTELEGFAAV